MRQRNLEWVAVGAAVHGRDVVAPREGERHILEPQRLSDRFNSCGQHGICAKRALEPATQTRERGVGVVSLAVHALVHEPLHAFAERLKAHGHDARERKREREVPPVGQCRPDHADDEHVARNHGDRHRPIDESAVDDEVELVQPVLEHRDRSADGKREQRDRVEDVCVGKHAPRERCDRAEADAEDEGAADPAELLALLAERAAEPQDKGQERRNDGT